MRKAITCVLIAMLPACGVYEDDALEDDAQADESAVVVGTLSATPDPLTFPKALVGQTVNAMLTVTNNAKPKTLPRKISAVSAPAPFAATGGGTCHSKKYGMQIGPGQSCTLEFSFAPTKPNTVVVEKGSVRFEAKTILTFELKGVGLEFGLTAVPDPLEFPDATFGGTTCGSPGGTACTYAIVMLHNNLPTAQTIISASATPPFWVTWGGSCNNLEYQKTIPAYGGCELQFGFAPDAAGTDYSGKGTVSFESKLKGGLNLSFGLEGSSTK